MRHTLSVLTVLALLASAPLRAGDCEDQFSSAGSVFSGTDFAAACSSPRSPWPKRWARCAAS